MKIILVFLLTLLFLSACNTSPMKNNQKQINTKNKTTKILKGKRMTSLAATTVSEKKRKAHIFLWCQYTRNIKPDATRRLRSGICYSKTDYPKGHHIRILNNDGSVLQFPKASSAELNNLKQNLISIDFANIHSVRSQPNSGQELWSALFCYEDPNKPQERAQCMEASAPLTHPKTDAVLQVLQRFAQGNSMDLR